MKISIEVKVAAAVAAAFAALSIGAIAQEQNERAISDGSAYGPKDPSPFSDMLAQAN